MNCLIVHTSTHLHHQVVVKHVLVPSQHGPQAASVAVVQSMPGEVGVHVAEMRVVVALKVAAKRANKSNRLKPLVCDVLKPPNHMTLNLMHSAN